MPPLTWDAGAASDNKAVAVAKDSEEEKDDTDLPPASEDLIAAALKAGTITYEESLRQRAFAGKRQWIEIVMAFLP